MANLTAVLLVFMFVFAIMGMNLFGSMGPWPTSKGITRNANFKTFGSSMLVLFR